MRLPRPLRRLFPRTFQGRLTIAFVTVIALTLGLVTILVINRLDDYFTRQQSADLELRSATVGSYVEGLAASQVVRTGRPVVGVDGRVDPAVVAALNDPAQQRLIADQLGQADVLVRFGLVSVENGEAQLSPSPNGDFLMPLQAPPQEGQTREDLSTTNRYAGGTIFARYLIEITLANPYTFRASAIANLTGLLGAITLGALGLAVVVSALMARRFTTPLRRLTEVSRALAEGDLSRRVPPSQVRAGSSEMAELAVQFNAMADQLEESVEFIRRDRDRSRDFLADVSHELRTPLAALRMVNELLRGTAGENPETRAEFLESSGQQLERLDWFAQNLLELSKLDSGLVLLDLRPDDLRAAVESAADQSDASARRKGVSMSIKLPTTPVRIRHDPQRIGQVVANLVANAVKFTPRGGSVTVEVAATPDGAQIDVSDTGVGIDPTELPRIFDRFYRGSHANPERGTGSGLGLAIVRSIVEMHGGTVAVESRVGGGSRFTVQLPADPRLVAGTPAADHSGVPSSAGLERDGSGNMTETSPSEVTRVNPEPAP